MSLASDEEQRVAALRDLQMLDTEVEERFERITRMAQHVFHVPIALVSLVEVDRQWFKSCQGLDVRETPITQSFCAHAIQQDDVFVVPDATHDPRFRDNGLVTGPPYIRFYAGYPLRSPSRHKVGTLCIIDREPRDFDTADQRRLQDLASWAERELNDLARQRQDRERLIANMGHELRTPLTALLGSLGLLREDLPEQVAAELEPYLDVAFANSRRVGELLNELLDAERVSSGRQSFNLETLDLLRFLSEMEMPMSVGAQRRGCHFRLQPGSPPARLRADRQCLVQALAHLHNNACKFTAAGSTVTLSARLLDGGVELSVHDQGPGIAADMEGRLFQPFAQSAAVQFGKLGGMGLGLYLCKALIEGMGGRVGADSVPGQGCRFHIWLPAVAE